MEWVLVLLVQLPDHTYTSHQFVDLEPQSSLVECNKLKLLPDKRQAVLTYQKFTGRYAELTCMGIPITRA